MKLWGEAFEGEVEVVGAQVASCKGGRGSAQTPATLWGGHLWRWGEEVEGSWVEVQESPDALEVWGKAGERGTGSESWGAERAEVGGTA